MNNNDNVNNVNENNSVNNNFNNTNNANDVMFGQKYHVNTEGKNVSPDEVYKASRDMTNRIDNVNRNVMNSAPKNLSHSYAPKPNIPKLQDKVNNATKNVVGNANANKGKTKGESTEKSSDQKSNIGNRNPLSERNPLKNKKNGVKDKLGSLLSRRMGLGAASNAALGGAGVGNAKGSADSTDNLTSKNSVTKSGAGFFKLNLKLKIALAITAIASVFVVVMIITIATFTIYTMLDNMGLNADALIEGSADVIEEKLDGADDNKVEKALDKALSYSYINTTSSIYNIKLSNANILAKTVDNSLASEFNIGDVAELYPPVKENTNSKYAYAFYYKLSKVNNYYKELCNKQVLDLPLLMITLRLESENLNTIYVSNLGYVPEDTLTMKKIDDLFDAYIDYYYDWSSYTYSRYTSTHDMEILAQHMVKVNGMKNCTYDEEGYNEFLKEFIEKKYYLSTDRAASYGLKSSNYFQTYDLTEDQLIQIASLCGQEQGHSNPKGAAAEASLMANKFEISGGEYAEKYSNSGDALYHYVRGTGKEPKDWWWAKAPKFMDERRVIPEVLEAVRDVLINGNRTLPKYVVSHDCPNCGSDICKNSGKVGDICEVKTNGITYTTEKDVANRSNYIPHVSRVQNVYGSSYKIFYSFPSEAGDPFSYKDPKLREKYGDCHYDPDKKEFVDCVDLSDALIDWLVKIADDNSHGYSQIDRASLTDFDCSSFVYYGLLNSGFNTVQLGSSPFTTRSERSILRSLGFKEIEVNSDGSNLKKGDILWTNGHTEVYIGENMSVGAHAASDGSIHDGELGDQNGNEISVVSLRRDGYWMYAYRYER